MTKTELDDVQVDVDSPAYVHLYANVDLWLGEYPIHSLCGMVTKYERGKPNPNATKCPICLDLDGGRNEN